MSPTYRGAMKQYPDDDKWVKWDICSLCRRPPEEHVSGKCLFATTTYLLEEIYAHKCIISHSPAGTVVHIRGNGRDRGEGP
jgi:hypothetical protein